MKVYEIDGIVPVVDPTAYVHPSAVLIGDVVVGAGAYIGPSASLRAPRSANRASMSLPALQKVAL